ncbi:MAG: UDP-N-acetylglucosamine 2-epimerase (non-hydrolyzing) [Legionella sp.]|nr:UDP-N-acetylglucosamine 2-epimerase (non-hydrolyzing) [Legionella sp.]
MKKFNIVCVIGTRSEALKMIPVIKSLQKIELFGVHIIITGQYRELFITLLYQAQIKETIHFDVMVPNQSLGMLSSNLFAHFDEFFSHSKCDLVIAQGDTTTTLVAALSAFYRKIPFAHIEAGRRTASIDNPFPEELNRRAISLVSQLHFCPTQLTANNLIQQGINSHVYVTGNTIIDTLYECARTIPPTSVLEKKLILVTCHRKENCGQPLINICIALKYLAERNKNTVFLLPVHPNVCGVIETHLSHIDNIILSPPLEYKELVGVLKNCYFVLTDSCGLQEEAPALHKPVLVLRTETDRVEAVSSGAALLVGHDIERIITEVEKLLYDEYVYMKMCNVDSPYGDGQAAARIVQITTHYLAHQSDFPQIIEPQIAEMI